MSFVPSGRGHSEIAINTVIETEELKRLYNLNFPRGARVATDFFASPQVPRKFLQKIPAVKSKNGVVKTIEM